MGTFKAGPGKNDVLGQHWRVQSKEPIELDEVHRLVCGPCPRPFVTVRFDCSGPQRVYNKRGP